MSSSQDKSPSYLKANVRAKLISLFLLTVIVFLTVSAISIKLVKNATVAGDEVRNAATMNVDVAQRIQVYYEKQVSEWQNVLLRGYERGLYHEHIKNFYQNERSAKRELLNLKNKTHDSHELQEQIKRFEFVHLNAGKVLRSAVKVFNNSQENAHIIADRFGGNVVDEPRVILSEIRRLAIEDRILRLEEIEKELHKNEVLVFSTAIVVLILLSFIFFLYVDKHVGQPAAEAFLLGKELSKHRDELEKIVSHRTADLKASNAELESYSYSIAHDLRSPLRAVTSFSQIILEEADNELSEENKAYLNRIIRAGKHMSQLIEDILSLSRVSRKKLKYIENNASVIVEDIIKELRVICPTRHVRIDIESEILLQGDKSLIMVLLDNLLNNAWKYSSNRDEAVIEFGKKRINDSDIIYVKDNGIGFDMSYSNNIYKPFQRLHNTDEFSGTGVGLAIVDRVIKRHGGKLWVESEVGVGTCFYFTLAGDNHTSQHTDDSHTILNKQ